MANRSPDDLTALQRELLVAVVEGYRARAGMKDRIRALKEWEIARRAGHTELSYAQYARDPSRDGAAQALSLLERRGLVSTWERGGNYDTFVPTDRAASLVGSPEAVPRPAPAAGDRSADQAVGQAAPDGGADPIVQRLDVIIELLRSIEKRLPT